MSRSLDSCLAIFVCSFVCSFLTLQVLCEYVLGIPDLCFYGFPVCANTYVSASIYASPAFALALFLMLVVFCPKTFGFLYLIFLFHHCSLYACFLTRDRTGVYPDGRESGEGYIRKHRVRTDF